MEKSEIGNAIFELRIKYNISVEQLADSIGEDHDTIRAWEIGNGMPNTEQMKKIAIFFQSVDTNSQQDQAYYKNADKSVTGRFINYAGGDTTKRLRWRDLFSDTFKKGNYRGYFKTKTIEDFDINNFQKPFIYIRIFAILAAIFGLTLLINYNPLTIIAGTIVVPLTLFMFTWELNVYHNIKFSKCLIISFIGGALAIIITLIFSSFVTGSWGEMSIWTAINVAVVEEMAKALIVYIFIKKLRIKAILPAIVIGMSIGTGFAVIESCMYAFNFAGNFNIMIQTILLRGVFSLGGHTVWATISASAMVKVANYKPIMLNTLINFKFLQLFLIPVALHTIWNGIGGIITYIILTLLGLSIFIAMVNIGLKEASYIKDAIDKENYTNKPNIS